MKKKTSAYVIPAFKSIFSEAGKPKKLQTDKGSEFLSRPVQKLFKKEGIHHFTTENETIKASVVERFLRTIKERLWRVFTHKNSVRFVEVLPKLISSYNETYHTAIKRRPIDVVLSNQEDVWQTLYAPTVTPKTKVELPPGSRVRLIKSRTPFTKGYLPSWTEELFSVEQTLKTTPVTYTLRDDHNEVLKGTFYPHEIQRVGEKEEYLIEQILKRRKTRKGRVEVLVKWLGYPNSFNSWIPNSSVQHYKERDVVAPTQR